MFSFGTPGGNLVRALFGALFVFFAAGGLDAQDSFLGDLSFDISTTAQEDGSLTEGYVSAGLTPGFGVRVNYVEQASFGLGEVPATRFSTEFDQNERVQADLLFRFREIPLEFVRSAYLGFSYINIDELQSSTFVQIDEDGEFGTDYSNERTTTFYSPRIGFTLASEPPSGGNRSLGFDYTFILSPVYFVTVDQVMTFDTEAVGEEEYQNDFSEWSSPYLNHELRVDLWQFARFVGYHSYQFIQYSTLQVADDGFSIEPVDDPVHINTVRANLELTLPIGESTTLNFGGGYQASVSYRAGDAFSEDDRMSWDTQPYLRFGASVLEF